MNRRHKIALWAGIAMLGAALVFLFVRLRKEQPLTLTGVVITQNPDPGKQAPIAGVEINAANGEALHGSRSDSTGLFHISLHRGLKRGQTVTLTFRHPDYEPLDLTQPAGKMLYVVRMSPLPRAAKSVPGGPATVIAQVSIRYSVKTSTTADIGSVAKTFQVVNTGNVTCGGEKPCSPDGKWKAAIARADARCRRGQRVPKSKSVLYRRPMPFHKDRFQ